MRKISFIFMVSVSSFSMDYKKMVDEFANEKPIACTSYDSPTPPQSLSDLRASSSFPNLKPSPVNPILDTMLQKHKHITGFIADINKDSELHRRRADEQGKRAAEHERLSSRNKKIGLLATVVGSIVTYLLTNYFGKKCDY